MNIGTSPRPFSGPRSKKGRGIGEVSTADQHGIRYPIMDQNLFKFGLKKKDKLGTRLSGDENELTTVRRFCVNL